jgi:hypothetical protein
MEIEGEGDGLFRADSLKGGMAEVGEQKNKTGRVEWK